MSCDWGLRCIECDKQETWFNHGERLVFNILRVVRPIAYDLSCLVNAIEWLTYEDRSDNDGILQFLIDHPADGKHTLVEVNEYGDISSADEQKKGTNEND